MDKSLMCGMRNSFVENHDSAEVVHLRSQLKVKVNEIATLREELKAREVERNSLLANIGQYQDIIEAQEAEVARIRNNQPGGAGSSFWEEKCNIQEASRKQAESRASFLETELERLSNQLGRILSRTRADPNRVPEDEEDDPSGYHRSDGVAGFAKRLGIMQQGGQLQLWQKDKFVTMTVRLSPDALNLTISDKKKVIETIALRELQSIVYPSWAASKKGKESGKDFMKFALVAPDQRVFRFLANSHEDLTTWYIGLQNLVTKPGQRTVLLGEFLWMKTRARLPDLGIEHGLTAEEVLAQAFTKIIPPDTTEGAGEGDGADAQAEGGDAPQE
eukprot:c2332_g1_i1.p1 GENE.c2332_g1_i1~~c2332_g1_i1.p1  ORF type:complete len:332 (+),score=80.26 c2332_g1_i1:54-1049(+)